MRRFERQDARDHALTIERALEVFGALWAEASALNPDFPGEGWQEDLEPDLAVARAVNGLPPAP